MLTTPLLAPWLHRTTHRDALVFASGEDVVALGGDATRALLPRLLPLLDGTRTIDDLAEALGEPVRPAVEAALTLLEQERLVVEGPPLERSHVAAEAAFAVAAQVGMRPPSAIASALLEARVEVRGAGTTAAAIARGLLASGLKRTTEVALAAPATARDLVVVAPRPDELPVLPAWNRLAVEEEIAWLAVLPFDGAKAFVGPLSVPGQSACFECFSIRRAANVPFGDELKALAHEPAPFPVPAFLDDLLGGLATLAAVRWLGADDPLFVGAAYAVELGVELAVGRHTVYRVPRCPVCSPSARVSPVSPWSS